MEKLAAEIDALERHIDTYGSVAPKKPDVWGESRLMRYRDEYERQLEKQVGEYKTTINASIRRRDISFLASALSLQASTTGTPVAFPLGKDGAAASPGVAAAVHVGTQPSVLSTDGGVTDDALSQDGTLQRFSTKPFGEESKVALEPQIFLDQMSRYLKHLQNLRQLNAGADNSDAPGYALHRVRIPVSVLPGKKTKQGYGAEMTVTLTPVFDEEFLARTTRNLVINDVADQFALPLTQALNDAELLKLIKGFYAESDAGKLREAELTLDGAQREAVETFKQYASKEFLRYLAKYGDGRARFINPHNAFLSIIRFNGLFPFILFVMAFIIVYVNYFKLFLHHRNKPRFRIMESTIVIFLTMSFINVMLSGGTYTRNFFLFFALGYAIGYFDLLKSVQSEKQYAKSIF